MTVIIIYGELDQLNLESSVTICNGTIEISVVSVPRNFGGAWPNSQKVRAIPIDYIKYYEIFNNSDDFRLKFQAFVNYKPDYLEGFIEI